MAIRQPRYHKDGIARLGDELYEARIRQQVEVGNQGKIVAIDVETGAFEVADEPMVACDRLLEQYPDAQIWAIRIGHQAMHRFGIGRLL